MLRAGSPSEVSGLLSPWCCLLAPGASLICTDRDQSDTRCCLVSGPLPRAVTSLGLMALCDIWEPGWGDQWAAPVAQPSSEFTPRSAACTESESRARGLSPLAME